MHKTIVKKKWNAYPLYFLRKMKISIYEIKLYVEH